MSKFFLFMWHQYGESGGIGDLKGNYTSQTELEQAIVTTLDENGDHYDSAEMATLDGDDNLVSVHTYWYMNYLFNEKGEMYNDPDRKQPKRWIVQDTPPVRELHV